MSTPNPEPTRHRQETRRRLVREGQACVELGDPAGNRVTFDLLNISRTGVCFGVDGDWIPEPGLTIEDVVLRVADLAIAGRLLIVHRTEGFSSGSTCGAEFQPFFESDAAVIAEAIQQFPVYEG